MKVLFSVGLTKLNIFFRKPTNESILLISGFSLFHSFIIFGKKNFLKISIQHSAANLALHAHNFASAIKKNVVPKFTNRLSMTLHNLRKYKGFL